MSNEVDKLTESLKSTGITKGDHQNIKDPVAAEETKKKKQTKRLRWSNLFVTINTNVVIDDPDSKEFTELEDKFVKAVESIFNEKDIFNYIVFKEQDQGKGREQVKSVKVDGKTEIGSERRQLHIHALCAVSHYTKIKYDYNLIRKKLKDEMGMEIYFNGKVFSKAETDITEYINKNVKF